MKACKSCEQLKQLDAFYRDKRKSDGRWATCKECVSARARRKYAENPEPAKARAATYYRANTETCKERARKHREHSWAAYYEVNRERYLEQARRYYQENRGRWKEYGARRRAAIGEVTPEVAAYVATFTEKPCVYCGSSSEIETDHIIPLARGGTHTVENLAPACRPCNRSKGAKLVSEWLEVSA